MSSCSGKEIAGNRAYLSGHVPQALDGSITGPFGKVGAEVSIEEARAAARLVALGLLARLYRELGDLDRVQKWLRLFGMVNAVPEFDHHSYVLDGCSQLIVEVYGPERGRHARSAVGVSGLPFSVPVEVEAEVEVTD